jgi:hypothetical protein
MSLIDEALKRAQEASRREGEMPQARPWTPAPMPDAGLARRRRVTRVLLGSVAAAAGLAAVALFLRPPTNARAPRVLSEAERAAAVPSPAPTLQETVVTAPATAAAPVRARPTHPVAPEPAAESAAAVPAAPPAPRALADGRSYIGVVDLPDGGRIELGGIVWSEDDPRALLNDRIVATDAYVAGFTVSKIEENRVELVRDGMTIYLSLK